jgi:hypothetical protein
MALYNLMPVGKYAVCETPRLLSRTTGDIKNQYALNSTDFASIPAQNGMLLVVDEFTGKVKLPTAITNYTYLHVSPVKDYEGKGKETVAVNLNEMLPVMYKLNVGDTIITNAVIVDDVVYANVAAITAAISATAVFGIPDVSGHIKLVAALGGTEVVGLKALAFTTLANGRTALKFVVVKA